MEKELALVVVGASLGIAGALLGSLVTHVLARRAQREQWKHEAEIRKQEQLLAETERLSEPISDSRRAVLKRQLERGGMLIPRQMKGCFLAGTKVSLSNGSCKPIEEIRVGDELLSYDLGEERITNATVQAVDEQYVEEYVVLNRSLRMTPSHHVVSNGDYMRAGNLRVGDKLLDADGNWPRVMSIELIAQRVHVFNVTVGEGKGIFVEGFLVGEEKASGILVGDHAMKMSRRD